MNEALPYCGAPPSPGELLARFNLDPLLIVVLVVLGTLHVLSTSQRRARWFTGSGWTVAAAAFLSPVCALSVSLFSARIAQHMILLLVAAPLIALGSQPPAVRRGAWGLWFYAVVFFVALWLWHMPTPYDATFSSSLLYWTMHVTLFGSGVLLWRELLHHSRERTADALVVGLLTSMQMGLLGAVLSLAARPLFFPHFTTASAWGLTPLQDQQLGGILMWVPGILLFLWTAIRSLRRLLGALEAMNRNESRPARLS